MSHRVSIDEVWYVPAADTNGGGYLEPRRYVAANLHALLTALRPHGFDTGDWFGQLILWAEAQEGWADCPANADYEAKVEGLKAL